MPTPGNNGVGSFALEDPTGALHPTPPLTSPQPVSSIPIPFSTLSQAHIQQLNPTRTLAPSQPVLSSHSYQPSLDSLSKQSSTT